MLKLKENKLNDCRRFQPINSYHFLEKFCVTFLGIF